MMREKLLTKAVKQPALLFLMVIPFREKPCVLRAIPPEKSAGAGHTIIEIDDGIAW
jgi:hypothetical protein